MIALGDKQALLPGQGPATFANYTGFVNGLNGVMVDVNGLPTAQTPTAADFGFRMGRDGEDGTFNWTEGPAASVVNVRRAAGVNASDRVTLLWRNFNPADVSGLVAVADGWLEVTVRATAATGLTKPDVFYFGNLRGDTGAGDSPGATRATVNALDLAAVRTHLVVAEALVTNPYDVTRDGTVGAVDRAAIRANLFHSLRLITVPTTPAAADEASVAQPLATALIAAASKRTDRVWDQETSDPSDLLA